MATTKSSSTNSLNDSIITIEKNKKITAKVTGDNSTIDIVKNEKITINPITLLSNRKEFLPDNYLFNHSNEIEIIKKDLLRGELNTYAKNDYNQEFLETIQNIVLKLPQLPQIQQQKLNVPEFEEIEIMKSDTVEIKKFIQKMNLEFIGYYCNHKVADEKCEMVGKNSADILESKEYKHFEKMVDDLARYVWDIRYSDRQGKVWKESFLLPLPSQIKELIDSMITLAGNISKFNARMNPECSRCKAEVRKYNYVIKEVRRMREENEEMKQKIEEQNNEEVDIPTVIRQRFGDVGIERFELRALKDKLKKLYGLSHTMAELTKIIDEMPDYKVSNVHGTKIVCKL